jgi:hypothetical protein
MKKAVLIFYLILICGNQSGQIVADHSIVNQYENIPEFYINKVKQMLVDIAGESHSLGYRIGMDLLELLNPRYQVITFDGSRPAYTDQYLRIGKHGNVGESDFYTSQANIENYKTHITSQNNTGNPYAVIGFGWCWDMTWMNAPGGPRDPDFNVRWAGSSVGGSNGNLRWGLNAEDLILTGNSVCMDTYLNAVEQYILHCTTNGYATKAIFTTGPVDNGSGIMAGTENGYQREVKHDYIRNYVKLNSTRILFDYADILCWNDAGVKYMTYWNDGGVNRPHVNIHPDNMMDYDVSWNRIPHAEDGDHIGEVGALRLAKAMWWMLARIAGWNGVTTGVNENHLNKKLELIVRSQTKKLTINVPEDLLYGNIYITNLNGQIFKNEKISGKSLIFDFSNVKTGIYIIIARKNNLFAKEKIVLNN